MRAVMSRITRKQISFWCTSFLIAALFCVTPMDASGTSMPLPESRVIYHYDATPYPFMGSHPAGAKPAGIAYTENTAGIVYLDIGVPRFSASVDIYAAYTDSAHPDVMYILQPDMSFRATSLSGVEQQIPSGIPADAEPWKRNVTTMVYESFQIDVLQSALPLGTYKLYLAVTPSNDRGRYFIWETSFELLNFVKNRAALRSFDTCDDVVRVFKDRAIREMEKNIDVLIEAAKMGQWGCWMPVFFSAAPPPAAPPPVTGEASQYSTTNVQVAGVDEADFIKNDGGYIYILADGRFQIIDAWPPQDSRVISFKTVEGEPKKLFVANGKALVYSSLAPVARSDFYNGAWIMAPNGFPWMPECTYGYDCDFTGDGRKLKITVFDISDPSAPEVEREMWLEGSFINARRIGSAVHTVVLSPEPTFPGISYQPDIDMESCNYYDQTKWREVVAALEALKKKNRQIIEDAMLEDTMLPKVKDTRYLNGSAVTEERLLTDCSNFYEPGSAGGNSFLTLLTLGIDDSQSFDSTTLLGKPGAVYASPTSFYIAARNYYHEYMMSWIYLPPVLSQETTTIHKFDLSPDGSAPSYAASGMVKGRVLNQFSMDEYKGNFRIATTSGHVPDPKTHSTVSILKEENGSFVTVGQLDGIAPAEDIRSARFYGDKGFLVTFKTIDPLFSLDLSKPAKPRIAGELKIPGFSTYMHMMDGDHLLTIGYDAKDMGSYALFQGVMLQIFDVSDLKAPLLLHKEVIGTRGTASDAATNHLAFNYFPPKGLLALPMTVCEDKAAGQYYGTMTFSGLLVYDISVQNGFSEKGRISHVDPVKNDAYSMCGMWWTVPDSVVKRSIFMDDYVYSVALDMIKADHLDNLGLGVAEIDLTGN